MTRTPATTVEHVDRGPLTRDELAGLRHKPDSLGGAVWGVGDAIYDPLEVIVA